MADDELKRKVLKAAMEEDWAFVSEKYKSNPDLRTAVIDKSKDTILHVAILKGDSRPVDRVKELVGMIGEKEKETVLGAKNEKGNTPLHLATALEVGSLEMCKCLAEKFPAAIKMENDEHETPFYMSAKLGKTDLFFRLLDICSDAKIRRSYDGSTILHTAISNEHFELAHNIIKKYKEIDERLGFGSTVSPMNPIDKKNANGHTPLHVLAGKPTSFESGNPPGIFDRLLYKSVIFNMPNTDEAIRPVGSHHPNYATWMTIYDLIKEQLKLLRDISKKSHEMEKTDKTVTNDSGVSSMKSQSNDIENGKRTVKNVSSGSSKESHSKDTEKDERTGVNQAHDDTKQRYPPTYETFFHLLKFIFKLLIVVLGFGIVSIKEIQERKKKHKWANLVMEELIKGDPTYYSVESHDGGKPDRPIENGIIQPLANEDLPPDPNAPSSKDQGYATMLINIWDAMENKETRKPLKDILKETGTKIHEDLKQYDLTVMDADGPTGNTKRLNLKKREVMGSGSRETPFLTAAKSGITEIVTSIMRKYPIAIHDTDDYGKNALLLAVENRQTRVFNILLDKKIILREWLLRQVDKGGNNALHLAAIYGEHRPKTPGYAMQMQWEMKWFEFVKKWMPREFWGRKNEKGQTPHQVMIKSHEELNTKAGEWISKTSESCSVVAALIATVAFATSATIPGGNQGDTGQPNLQDKPLFHVFAISSLIALCLSVTSLVLFLTILTSRFQPNDFFKNLPRRLLIGLTSLFASIAAILVSFCTAHFFLLQESVKNAAYPIYLAICVPVTYFGLSQLHLYIDLMSSIFLEEPEPDYIIS